MNKRDAGVTCEVYDLITEHPERRGTLTVSWV